MTSDNWLVIQTALIGVGILSFLFKDFFSRNRDEIKTNTKETKQNTVALITLKVEIESLRKTVELLPKLKSDMDSVHEKLRRHDRTRNN